MHCQTRYEQIHKFLSNRRWAQVSNDDEASGTTWMELFVFFDIAGERTEDGRYQKDRQAAGRASKRKTKTRRANEETPSRLTAHVEKKNMYTIHESTKTKCVYYTEVIYIKQNTFFVFIRCIYEIYNICIYLDSTK